MIYRHAHPRPRTTARRSVTAVALAAALGLLAACGGGDGVVDVSGAWARTSPMSASAGAVYMDLTADEDQRLVAASVPADVAASVEIHETVMRDDAMAGDDGMSEEGDMAEETPMEGAMTMRELEGGLALPAGETVSLEPGGLHIMLLDLPDPLESGESFDLTLEFDSGDTQVVSIEVGDEAP